MDYANGKQLWAPTATTLSGRWEKISPTEGHPPWGWVASGNLYYPPQGLGTDFQPDPFIDDNRYEDEIDDAQGFGEDTEIKVSAIMAMNPAIGMMLIGLLRKLGATIGTRVGWSTLPGWARQVLVVLGITEGVPILFDTGEDDTGLVPIPPGFQAGPLDIPVPGFLPGGGGNGAPGPPTGDDSATKLVRALYVGGWHAGGWPFYRLADGRLAVRNRKGVWKIWRPKKPVVLFATGNRDMQDIHRADRIIEKETTKMKKTLSNRGFVTRRRKSDS
jgi:hypothetical protein